MSVLVWGHKSLSLTAFMYGELVPKLRHKQFLHVNCNPLSAFCYSFREQDLSVSKYMKRMRSTLFFREQGQQSKKFTQLVKYVYTCSIYNLTSSSLTIHLLSKISNEIIQFHLLWIFCNTVFYVCFLFVLFLLCITLKIMCISFFLFLYFFINWHITIL
jgi:hypothetical protein